ncbi:hypothetical protein M080_5820, partial [Bacteroides fragilis str. 3397 T10]
VKFQAFVFLLTCLGISFSIFQSTIGGMASSGRISAAVTPDRAM